MAVRLVNQFSRLRPNARVLEGATTSVESVPALKWLQGEGRSLPVRDISRRGCAGSALYSKVCARTRRSVLFVSVDDGISMPSHEWSYVYSLHLRALSTGVDTIFDALL